MRLAVETGLGSRFFEGSVSAGKQDGAEGCGPAGKKMKKGFKTLLWNGVKIFPGFGRSLKTFLGCVRESGG